MSKKQGKKSFAQDMALDFGRQLEEDSLLETPVILTQGQDKEKKNPKAGNKSAKTEQAAVKPQAAAEEKKVKASKATKSPRKNLKNLLEEAAAELTEAEVAKTKLEKSPPKKSFSDSLEAFFQDSIGDFLRAEDTELALMKQQVKKPGQAPKKAVGIEALLRRTLKEEQEAELQAQTARLTLILDQDKIERLKRIARQENRPLQELVTELLERYLQGR